MAGLYIHIPFCASRCIYCGFYSTTSLKLRQRYVDAVCQEMILRGEKSEVRSERIETVYLGGGTPSQLTITDEKELGKLLTFITMDQEILVDSLKVLSGVNVDDDTEGTETRGALDVLSVLNDRYSRFWKYINDLRGDNGYPYVIQAFKELGASEYAFLHVDGTFLTPTQVRDVNEIFSVQHQFSGIFRQDEGALMRNFGSR